MTIYEKLYWTFGALAAAAFLFLFVISSVTESNDSISKSIRLLVDTAVWIMVGSLVALFLTWQAWLWTQPAPYTPLPPKLAIEAR